MPTTIKLKNSVTTTSVPSSLVQGEVAINITDKKVWVGNAATTPIQIAGAGVTGDVVGPASATDNAISRFDATTGKLIQNSLVTVSDTGAISAPVDASISGLTVGKGGGASGFNTAVGNGAANANTTGVTITAVGYRALYANTSGNNNVAIGESALLANTTGSSNTAVGVIPLGANTTGANNVAVGQEALRLNTTASNNTAVGYQAGYANTTGSPITAVGYRALRSNTTGNRNFAFGADTLYNNTTGASNVAFGGDALNANTTGSNNTAMGDSALLSNTTASDNTAVGYQALYTNATGTAVTALGYKAGFASTGSVSVYVGYNCGVAATGSSNTFIGSGAGEGVTSGAKNTIVGRYNGNQGGLDIRTASNYIVLSDGDGNPRMYFLSAGEPVIPRLTSSTTGSAANVFVSSTTGELVRSTSSLKYKRDVQDATHGLTEVLQLRPVTYKGKSQVDGETVFGGLIAEEVHDAGLTEFVQYAPDGSPDALAYGNMVSLCVKAIQELKAEVDSLKAQLNK